jgi:hypothetical protein
VRIGVEMVDADGKPVRKGWIEAEDAFDAILPVIDAARATIGRAGDGK